MDGYATRLLGWTVTIGRLYRLPLSDSRKRRLYNRHLMGHAWQQLVLRRQDSRVCGLRRLSSENLLTQVVMAPFGPGRLDNQRIFPYFKALGGFWRKPKPCSLWSWWLSVRDHLSYFTGCPKWRYRHETPIPFTLGHRYLQNGALSPDHSLLFVSPKIGGAQDASRWSGLGWCRFGHVTAEAVHETKPRLAVL